MLRALCHAKVHDSRGTWLENTAVIVNGNVIHALLPEAHLNKQEFECIDLSGCYLVPGFVDTQVNGGGGCLFNDAPNLETLTTMAKAHRSYGTTAMLPTLISDDTHVIAAAFSAVDQAIAQNLPGIVGLHIEGPFLNALRKGVHNEKKFRQLDADAVALLSSLKSGVTLLTLAPEQNADKYILALINSGVVVAAGHSAATYAQTRHALALGLSSFTHLYNAMTPLTSREPGVVGAALEDLHSWVAIIADGVHVHDAALKIAIAAKARGKVILVTDAMPSVGAHEKNFILNGEPITVDAGRCQTANGTLAGSDLDMLSAVKNCVQRLQVPLAEAINMASLYPAQMMKLAHRLGSIEVGKEASLLALNKDLCIQRLWQLGKEIHLE